MTLIPFLTLTFAISLGGFACIVALPSARSPESLNGLPFWLLMVWGPSLAAIILSYRAGDLGKLMQRAVTASTVPLEVWLLCIAPLLLLVLLMPISPDTPAGIGPGVLVAMVLFNLILGPLGEELGWRGMMQEHLNQSYGWLEASLIVGVVWLVWHLPLWTIDSPHAQIALPLFAVHCVLYAIIIGGAYTLSGGSILPAILLHLTFNLASNLALFAGFREANTWFAYSLLPYAVIAACTVLLVIAKTGQIGLRWLP